MTCRIVLAVLCGLPGSGKSYFVTRIRETYDQLCKEMGTIMQIIGVSYDNLLPTQIEQKLIAQDAGHEKNDKKTNSRWKQYRNCIVEAVESVVAQLLKCEQQCSSALTRELKVKIIADQELINPATSDVSYKLFLIEDNMYFKSMRYEYYQLARKYNIGFCQIYLHCNVDTALRRNHAREAPVDEAIIQSMKTKFEPPDPLLHSWEEHTILIDNSEDHVQFSWPIIKDFIENAFEHPVLALDDDTQQIAASQTICTRNVYHQVDIALRKLVSDKVKSYETTSEVDLKTYAARCNMTRQEVLAAIRAGDMSVGTDISQKIKSGNVSEVTAALSQLVGTLFHARLRLNEL